MRSDTKYVRFEYLDGSHDVIVIFSSAVSHQVIAGLDRLQKPVSAGFVAFGVEGPVAFGKSESLDLSAKPEDTRLVREALGLK